MSDQDIYNEIGAEEYGNDAQGPFEYRAERGQNGPITMYSVKVWNPNPQKLDVPKTPGLVITTKRKEGGKWTNEKENVDTIKAVILFSSPGRKLEKGVGKDHQTICSSHCVSKSEGEQFAKQIPSLRIKEPLCRKASAQDVAGIFSQWKNYDEAKVNAAVTEVTEGGKLQVCGIRMDGGFATLCPFAKKDPITGQKAACKPHIFVRAYDVERKREFTMELTGQSIDYSNRFVAPYHEFFKFIRSAGPVENGKNKGLPSYAFVVTLSALQVGQYYILNINKWVPIAKAENRQEMKEKARLAAEAYEKAAHRLSKEDYDKIKAQKAGTDKPVQLQEQVQAKPVVKSEPVVAQAALPVEKVSFEVDDIDF